MLGAMRVLLALLVALSLSAGCSSSPAPRPSAPVLPAPAHARGLTVHVHRLVEPPQTAEDEREYRTMPGLTTMLRHELQHALVRAGYTVIVDRAGRYDVVAKVTADWPLERKNAVATLVLLEAEGGNVIDQASVIVPPEGSYDFDIPAGGAALCDAVTRSARLEAAVKRLEKRRTVDVAGP